VRSVVGAAAFLVPVPLYPLLGPWASAGRRGHARGNAVVSQN
jgi:hypothetical protein